MFLISVSLAKEMHMWTTSKSYQKHESTFYLFVTFLTYPVTALIKVIIPIPYLCKSSVISYHILLNVLLEVTQKHTIYVFKQAQWQFTYHLHGFCEEWCTNCCKGKVWFTLVCFIFFTSLCTCILLMCTSNIYTPFIHNIKISYWFLMLWLIGMSLL